MPQPPARLRLCNQPRTLDLKARGSSMKAYSVFVLALLSTAAPAFASSGIDVVAPLNGARVSSGFQLSAGAQTCSGESVASMGYSLDGSSNTTVFYSQSISAKIAAPAGAHTLHVKSWAARGLSCVENVSIQVASAPTSPSSSGAGTSSAGSSSTVSQSVAVTSPANHATVTTPFILSASASMCSGQDVAAMGYSFDSSGSTTIVNGSSIGTNVVSGTGAHTLHVKAWGKRGSACVTDVALNVTPA